MGKVYWRLGSESNRRKRCCRPLHDHSATQPHGADDSLVEFELHLLTKIGCRIFIETRIRLCSLNQNEIASTSGDLVVSLKRLRSST